MSNVGFIRKPYHHLASQSANQEAPVQLRGREGRGVHVPAKATYCVLVLFISYVEKGTFWTGSDLTHLHTLLMQFGQQ